MKTLGIIFSNIHERDIPELTKVRTLASVPYGGRYRLIDFVLSNMVNSGITNIGIIAKYNYQSLMDHVQSGKNWGLARKNGGLTILPPFNDVSGGGVFNNRFEAIKSVGSFIRHNDADYVVMSDCDIVCNFDFAPAIAAHMKNNADITMVCRKKKLDPSDKYRLVVETDKDGKAIKVGKHDGKEKDAQKLVYTDFMIITRRLLLYIIDHSDQWGITSFSREILANTKEYNIYAYEMEGYYASVNSLIDYYNHSMELLDPDVVRELFYKGGAEIYTKVRDSAPAKFTDTSLVTDSMVADGCIIEGEVENSIIFRGCHIAKGAKVTNSIIMQDAKIDAGSTLNCVIMDKGAHVLDNRLLSGHPTHPYYIEKESVI